MLKFKIKAEYHQKLSKHATLLAGAIWTGCFAGRCEDRMVSSATEIRINFWGFAAQKIRNKFKNFSTFGDSNYLGYKSLFNHL